MARSPCNWKAPPARALRGAILLTSLSGFLPAKGQATNTLVSAVSSSRAFVVQSHSPERNIELGIWAEEVMYLLTDYMGKPIPLSRGQPVYLQLREDPKKEATVISRQQVKSRYLTQTLQVTNIDQADQEDMLEGLCQLLLSRYAMASQPPSIRSKRPAQVPAWFAVGIAQNLYPILRERNHRLCMRWQEENRLHGIPRIMEQRYLPRGRLRVKVMCGMFMDWLHEESRAGLISQMTLVWASGETVDASWLIKHQLKEPHADEKTLAKQWRLWLARARQAHAAFGGGIYDAVDQLKERLNLQPKTYGIPYPVDGPDTISFRTLPDHYEEIWFSPLVSKVAMRVALSGLGQPPAFQEIIKKYQAYLQTLQTLPAYPAKGRLSRVQGAVRKADDQLNEANLALAKYEEQVTKWRAYVDLAADTVTPTARTRTAFQLFVDQAEAKRKP
jgi:hypothetical protein